ncbi:MAG: M23 family metallopeptidase [Alphaproteobacteria bacterium]
MRALAIFLALVFGASAVSAQQQTPPNKIQPTQDKPAQVKPTKPAASKPVSKIQLRGKLAAGSLVIGQTVPGSTVKLNDKPLAIAADGSFVFGFGRDYAGVAALEAAFPDGGIERREFKIAKRGYPIQRIDGLPPKLVEPDPETMARIEKEYLLIVEARKVRSDLPFYKTGFIWPSQGRISGIYGSQRILNGKPSRPHYGVDVAAGPGAPIVAAAAGTVTLVHSDMYFTGQTVMVDHGMGVSTLYIHMSAIAVSQGETVKQGQLLGRVGSTGRSTGPHLHWGLNWFDESLDAGLLVGLPAYPLALKPETGTWDFPVRGQRMMARPPPPQPVMQPPQPPAKL